MSDSSNRRSFLKKVAAATGGAVFAAKGLANSESNMEKLIYSKKPLGFQWETQDPFLFCVHHEDFYPEGNDDMGPKASLSGRNLGQDFLIKDGWRMYHGEKVPGFPGHPHRGFETVTVVRKGMVDHSDSLGAAGRYGDGDVQWMTAGKGIQHAEMFPLINKDKPNTLELFQIWLNLPKKDKFVKPHFKMLWSDSIPNYKYQDNNGKQTMVEVIAGRIEGYKAPAPPPSSWAAQNDHEVAIWNIKMEAGASWELPTASTGVNRTIYFYEGESLSLNAESLDHYHMAEVNPTIPTQITAGHEGASILILQGKPIGEPVVKHGPFVMNTKQELQQAYIDFQQTRFGGWPWDRYDNVHERGQGRFAKHADGTVEDKSKG